MSFATTGTQNKRVRGKNYTDHERDVALKIIEKFKNIIDNKKTDAETIKLKNAAWIEVTDEFNSILPEYNRTPSQLRVFYENYKVKLRKELVEQGLKSDTDEISNKRIKYTDSEEKLIVKLQKPMPIISQINYNDRHNSIEASTSNTLHFRKEKNVFENNCQQFFSDSNMSNNYSQHSPAIDDDDECSSDPLRIVAEIDPLEEPKFSIQETNNKISERIKPSQAYAAIVESNKANCKLKLKKADYVDDYNKLKMELVQTELKLKNKEYENILVSSAMEQKMNAVRLKILECELEIKQEQLKKEREKRS